MPAQLIVTADDFGASESINSAVELARRAGLLTSASLMVAGKAASGAVTVANRDPELAVGLHLALSQARSVLPREAIPDLVDGESRFEADPVRAGLKYYISRRARMQLKAEIEAQFEAFARMGLRLSHVDGHQHLHLHPAVLPIVIELAARYGASGIRVPLEPLWPNLWIDSFRPVYKLVTALGHAYLRRTAARLIHASSLGTCDLAIGSLMSGSMHEFYVTEMLKSVKCDSLELFFHPDEIGGATDPFGPNPGDLALLISPSLKRFVQEREFKLTTYPGLRTREAVHAGR